MRYSICTIGLVVGVVGLVPVVHAQTEFPTPAVAPVTEGAPAAPAAQPVECVPQCRSGYLCVSGQCVSRCNPPCAAGEECRDGECLVPALLVPPPGPLEQNTPRKDPGFERHDGFMLRLTIGLGYGSTRATEEVDSDELVIRGLSGSFSIDLGGAIVENLILHARLSDLVIVNPKLSLNGEEVGESDGSSLAGILLAPGLTYYFMPANVYLTAALGLSWLTSDTDSSDAKNSDFGFGANIDVGKEWWVSDNWGLGAAGRFWLTALTDTEAGIDVSYTLLGFGVLFSATYN